MIDTHGFRANVGIVLLNDAGRVFWGRRVGMDGWQFPQGGIKEDETPEQAMYRELWEEVGLEAEHVEILAATRRWLRYRLPRRFVRYNQHPVCIGQKQLWFMLRLTADEACLNVERTDNPEFDDWCWLDYWDPIDRIVAFKRNVYRRALDELARCAVRGSAIALPTPPWQDATERMQQHS